MSAPSGGSARSTSRVSFREAFLHPAGWTLFFFGYSSGLPLPLTAATLAYWLKEFGIELSSITYVGSVSLIYTLKFLWAPVLDHRRPPVFGALGLRRGWLMIAQLGVIASLLLMAWLTPARLELFVYATLALAIFGASNDIAVDAYRIEIAPSEAQGALAATYVLGYRIGLLSSGALALFLASANLSWATVYVVMAALMLVPILATLRAATPATRVLEAPKDWLDALDRSVLQPLVDLFRRYGIAVAGLIIAFILLFKIPEQATVGGIMGPFYLDMGFSKPQIAAISKVYGVWIGIFGAFLGGALVARYGAWRSLGAMIVVCGSCNLLYLLLIRFPGDLTMLTIVISGENLTLGMLGPPSIAFLTSLVNREHTATQYALFSSLVNLPGKLLGVFAGDIAMRTGYGHYFILTVVALGPAMLLYAALWKRFDRAG